MVVRQILVSPFERPLPFLQDHAALEPSTFALHGVGWEESTVLDRKNDLSVMQDLFDAVHVSPLRVRGGGESVSVHHIVITAPEATIMRVVPHEDAGPQLGAELLQLLYLPF